MVAAIMMLIELIMPYNHKNKPSIHIIQMSITWQDQGDGVQVREVFKHGRECMTVNLEDMLRTEGLRQSSAN